MTTNVATNALAVQVAALIAPQLAGLQEQIDALDRGVINAGVQASRAIERTARFEQAVASAVRAAGVAYAAPSFTDPAAVRVQARKRRIEKSGLQLVRGDAS